MTTDLLIVSCESSIGSQWSPRLTPPLTREQARAAYIAMVMDTHQLVKTLAHIDIWYACPKSPPPSLRAALPTHACIVETRGDDHGERLDHAFRAAFDHGYKRVAVIEADSPDLPSAYIRAAFTRLTDEPETAVFGPSTTGGFYLAALAHPIPPLFFGIPWGTPHVMKVTEGIARRYGVTVALLPAWQDVKSFQDLEDCLNRNTALHLRAIQEAGFLHPVPLP